MYLQQFEEIKAVQQFDENSSIQKKLKRYLDDPESTKSDGFAEFLTYVLTEQNIPIKDGEWLWEKARHEVGFRWSYSALDEKTAHLYLRFENGVEYFGVVKRKSETSPIYLALVIEHRGVKNAQNSSLFF